MSGSTSSIVGKLINFPICQPAYIRYLRILSVIIYINYLQHISEVQKFDLNSLKHSDRYTYCQI